MSRAKEATPNIPMSLAHVDEILSTPQFRWVGPDAEQPGSEGVLPLIGRDMPQYFQDAQYRRVLHQGKVKGDKLQAHRTRTLIQCKQAQQGA